MGSAYYYFESKEDLVMAFYERAMEAMVPRLEAALDANAGFEDRVAALLGVKFDYFQSSRTFLGALLGHAADPLHRLSPFSEATRAIRDRDQEFFARAIAESREMRLPAELAAHLPRLLWLYQMGLILYWIYDRSPGQRQTRMSARKELGASCFSSQNVAICASETSAVKVRGTHCPRGRRAEPCMSGRLATN